MIARRVLPYLPILFLSPAVSAEEPAPIRLRHGKLVSSLAFFPDGKQLVTGCDDGFARVWDVATAKELRRFQTHTKAMDRPAPGERDFIDMRKVDRLKSDLEKGERCSSYIALSPNGKLLAATSASSNCVVIHDLAAREATRVIDCQKIGVGMVAFSPDGKSLATAPDEEPISLWDVGTGKWQRHCFGVDQPVRGLAFSPNGNTVAAATLSPGLCLMDANRERLSEQIKVAGSTGRALAYSRDGRLLAVAGNVISVWDIGGRTLLRPSSSAGEGGFRCLTFSRDDRFLALGTQGGGLVLWEVCSASVVCRLSGHRNGVWAVVFSPDGRTLASAGGDGNVMLWDWRNRAGLGQATAHKLSASDQQALWRQLADPAPLTAFRAVAELAGNGDAAVSLLQRELRPILEKKTRPIRDLIADLDHQRFAVRQNAQHELLLLGSKARVGLEAELRRKPTLESRRRIEQLLAEMANGRLYPEQVRQIRAVLALEMIATPAARRLLQELARSAPESLLGNEAAAVARRLESR